MAIFYLPVRGRFPRGVRSSLRAEQSPLDCVNRRGRHIGDGKRDKVQYILGRCPREKLTDAAKDQLQQFVADMVSKDEERFVKFFNKAQAINTRLHQFELLPGLGKKHTAAILEAREEKDFESFDDIRERVANMPSPARVIEKRIMEELTEIQRHNLFIA